MNRVPWNNSRMKAEIENLLADRININKSENEKYHTKLCQVIKQFHCMPSTTFLVNVGANVNLSCEANGETPLTICSELGYADLAEYLISVGANVHKPGHFGKTPLSIAIIYRKLDAIETKQYDIIDLLISQGAKVNFRYKLLQRLGRSPLIFAINTRVLQSVKLLIERGADVNLLDRRGNVPLIRAIEVNNLDIIELLIERGADVNLLDQQGTVPLIRAIETDNLDMMKLLLYKKPILDVIGNGGYTPLTKALEIENFQMTKCLIEDGAFPNYVDGNGKSPLEMAAIKNDIQCFEFLINSGAKVELVGEKLKEVAEREEVFGIFFDEWKKKNGNRNIIKMEELVGSECGNEEA